MEASWTGDGAEEDRGGARVGSLGTHEPGRALSVARIFDAHGAYVARVLRCLGVRERELSDASQEVFLVVHRRLPEFAGRASIRTWLYAICLRTARAQRRQVARRREDPVAEVPEPEGRGPTPQEALETRRALSAALALLASLDEDKRAVFVLHEVEQRPMAEVAALLGCPLQTAYARLYAARRLLRKGLRRREARLRAAPPLALGAAVGRVVRALRSATPSAAELSRLRADVLGRLSAAGGGAVTGGGSAALSSSTLKSLLLAGVLTVAGGLPGDGAAADGPVLAPVTERHAAMAGGWTAAGYGLATTPKPAPPPRSTEAEASGPPRPLRRAQAIAARPPGPLVSRPPAPPAVPSVPSAPSASLAEGLRLYGQDRWGEAAAALVPVLEGRTDDDRSGRERAHFVLAKSLHHLGLSHSAALAFEEIAGAGPAHPYFEESLPWLATLAESAPEPSALIAAVGRFTPAQLARLDRPETRDTYDHLLYLLGRRRYEERALPAAVALFRRVRPDSRWVVPARFFEGISHVRLRRARPAVAAFRAVIGAVDDGRAADGEDEDRLRDLAWISLARVYYAAAHDRGAARDSGRLLRGALAAWERVPLGSEYWLDSVFEQSWAHFVAGADDRALGRIHALLSPFFRGAYYPEAHVLRAVVYFQHCHLDQAEASVGAFHREYDPILASLRRVLARHPDNRRAYALLRGTRPGLPERVRGVVDDALGDRELRRHLLSLRALAAEEGRVAALPDGALSARLGQELAVSRALGEDRAGELARGRLLRLERHLQERMNEADAVQLEIHTIRRTGGEPRRASGASGRIVSDQEHQVWPFDGEFWRDELPYYRQAIGNLCGR